MSICDDIKRRYIRLSKGQRKVAQFVIDNPKVVATQIASEVGRLADVSESTVIRFCYAMDLTGFSELQEKVKGHLIGNGEMIEVKKALPPKKIKKHIGEDIVKQDIASISKTFNQLNERDVEEVVQMLHQSKKIHFLGVKQSAPALWLYNNIQTLRDQVYLVQHDADKLAQQLAFMDEESLLVVISLDSEYEDIAKTVEIAKRKNVKIVAIRDKELTSTPEPAEKVLFVPYVLEGGVTATIAIFALLHILVESVASQNPQQYEKFRGKRKNDSTLKSSKLIAII